MKPLSQDTIENIILENLSYYDSMSSNELHRKLHINKKKYTEIKNSMIHQGYIKEEKIGNRKYLNRIDFEDEKFQRSEYAGTARVNCKNYLNSLKKIKPICTTNNKNPRLLKNAKILLNAIFFQLDTIHIIGTRLEYAGAFGLMRKNEAKNYKSKCLELFDDIIQSLFSDHKEFKNEIIDHYQSQVRTIKFKL